MDNLIRSVNSLTSAIGDLEARSDAFYETGDNRRGNFYCDLAVRLGADLHRLEVELATAIKFAR